MNLSFRKLGSGHPIIILHGLYGCGDNWLSIGKSLSGFCEVFLLDQRNHGNSFHHDQHNYEVLMRDLKEFMDQQDISKTMILGHSMGGKVAMRFANEFPGMVSKLIIADVSPGSYLSSDISDHVMVHEKILTALINVDLSIATRLSDVEHQLESSLENQRLRKFLMKNLIKDEDRNYRWKLNLPALRSSLVDIAGGLDLENLRRSELSNFPVLFLRGDNSDYISERDIIHIKKIFPLSTITTLKNAGHWLHAEQPELFTRLVRKFILS